MQGYQISTKVSKGTRVIVVYSPFPEELDKIRLAIEKAIESL